MFRRILNIFNAASTEPDTTVFAIGDVHGYPDALQDIYRQIDDWQVQHPNKKFIEVHCGDLVNRGPDSAGVMNCVTERAARKDGVQRICVESNHDVAFRSFLRKVPEHKALTSMEEFFLNYGGMETLASYGIAPRTIVFPEDDGPYTLLRGSSLYANRTCIKAMQEELREKIPSAHLLYLERLKPSYTNGKYMFVHAGIDPNIPLASQDRNTMRGIDNRVRKFVEYKGPIEDNMVIVHGHAVSKKPYATHNQIGIDTGIFKTGHGLLTCAVLSGNKAPVFLQAQTALPAYEPGKSSAMQAAKMAAGGPSF